MAFGFGGGGGGGLFSAGARGLSVGSALGGLSLLGGAFVEFQAQREQAKAAREQARELQRQREAASIQRSREEQQRAQQRKSELGAIRARLAAQGLDLSSGSARRLLDLTASRFSQDERDAQALARLESEGFTSAIGAARRQRGTSQLNQFLLPSLSLLSGFGGRF